MDDHAELAQKSPELLQREAERLTPEEAVLLVQALSSESEPSWREKCGAVFLGLPERGHLEALGRFLPPEKAFKLIDCAKALESSEQWRLTALLAGFSHQLFMKLLCEGSQGQLKTLRQISLKEPLQHHLLMFVQEVRLKFEEMDREIEQLRAEIGALPVEKMSDEADEEFQARMRLLFEQYQEVIETISRALSLGWNTDRPDLLDKLNTLKLIAEKNQRSVLKELKKSYQARLESIYGDPIKPGDVEVLQDDDPALEALANLSLFYLSDYWEVGLLPEIEEKKLLEPGFNPAHEELSHRKELLDQVKQNLQKLGLSTVGDFKKKRIFSREMLKERIKELS